MRKTFSIFVLLVVMNFVSTNKIVLASGIEVSPLYEVNYKQIEEAGYSFLKQFNGVHGIYGILCSLDNKIYVGSAVDLKDRITRGHIASLNKNKHKNPHLQSSWKKHGTDNFMFFILETIMFKEDLILREQYWMDLTQCYERGYGYNISPTAGSVLGLPHTEEAKEKISRNNSKYWLDKTHSDETKEKISRNRKGKMVGKDNPMYGKTHSDKLKERWKKTRKGVEPWNKGLKGCQVPWNKGLTKEDPRIKKLADKIRGRKFPKELYPNMGFRNGVASKARWKKVKNKKISEILYMLVNEKNINNR